MLIPIMTLHLITEKKRAKEIDGHIKNSTDVVDVSSWLLRYLKRFYYVPDRLYKLIQMLVFI